MATIVSIRRLLEMLMEDNDDMIWGYINEQSYYETSAILQKRESVPNVVGYMEVINNMQIPENVES